MPRVSEPYRISGRTRIWKCQDIIIDLADVSAIRAYNTYDGTKVYLKSSAGVCVLPYSVGGDLINAFESYLLSHT